MIALQLLLNGIVTGCALGVLAISFSLVYATTRIFHVAHAGVYTLAGYVAWSMTMHGLPLLLAMVIAAAVCAAVGALIQWQLYERLARRQASPLVVLIASLGLLAVIQNVLAAIYTPNILEFPVAWSGRMIGAYTLRVSLSQLLTVVAALAAFAGTLYLTGATLLGKRIRAVAANPFLAEITRLEPRRVYVAVLAISSALASLTGVLVPLDLGLQPYNGITPLLTATIAMIAGGIGSIAGAFLLSLAIAIVQNLSLLVLPGEWGIGVTFAIFVIFMLFRPTGLFTAA